jgi:hypothetical protein
MSETLNSTATVVDQQQLAEQLLAQAREQGGDLNGPKGLLNQLRKNVLDAEAHARCASRLGSTWQRVRHLRLSTGPVCSYSGPLHRVDLWRLLPRACAIELSWDEVDPAQALALAPHASLDLSGPAGKVDPLPIDHQPHCRSSSRTFEISTRCHGLRSQPDENDCV